MDLFAVQYQMLENLADRGSTLAKKELLKKYLSDPTFHKIVTLALDSRISLHVKTFPKFKQKDYPCTEKSVFEFLQKLAHSKGATNQMKQALANLMMVSKESYEVISRICKKDLRCGVGTALINDVLPKTVFVSPYCRCSTSKKIDSIHYPAIVQEKADGMFVNIHVYDDTFFITTRDGLQVRQLHSILEKEFRKLPTHTPERVFMGELLALDAEGNRLQRQISNGIFLSCIAETADNEDLAHIAVHLWDYVPRQEFEKMESPTPYLKRFAQLQDLLNEAPSRNIFLIQSKVVLSKKEAWEFYQVMREQGKEGAVLKDRRALWCHGTSPFQVKLKNTTEADFIIVKWAQGAAGKKYQDCLGNITVQSADGKIVSDVGSGFSDVQRGYVLDKDNVPIASKADEALHYWKNLVDNRVVVEIAFEGIIPKENSDQLSLFLPRFIKVRPDRTQADTLEDIEKR